MQQSLFSTEWQLVKKKKYKHFGLRYANTKEVSQYMSMRQAQNKMKAKNNPNEQWMAEHLAKTGLKWTPQARWGFRIFDFWCSKLGIAVEVDGVEHDALWDVVRDEANYAVSGILVLRVRNRNEEDAARVLAEIATSESWNDRRAKVGKKPIRFC